MMFPIEFNTKQELTDYLDNFDFDSVMDTKLSSVYFLIEFDNHIMPIYFSRWDDVWFPSVCECCKYSLTDDEWIQSIKDLYDEDSWEDAYEFEKTMIRDGWHYEIHCFQSSPFLPNDIKIIDVFSDSECLDWMLSRRNKTISY